MLMIWIRDVQEAASHSHPPAGPYNSPLADEPGRRLYDRYGFVLTAPDSIGMRLVRSRLGGGKRSSSLSVWQKRQSNASSMLVSSSPTSRVSRPSPL